MELTRDEYLLSDDKSRLAVDTIHVLLNVTYWAAGRSREVIATSIEHSLCFGIFHRGAQVGFGRAITDHATFSYLCDIIISPEHRGRGLGKWLVEAMLAHPALQSGIAYLRTKDAHELYRVFGFKDSTCMRRGMAEDVCLPSGEKAC